MADAPQPSLAPNRTALIAGGVLLALAGGLYIYLTRQPCGCKEHVDGEAPLLEVAEASASMADPVAEVVAEAEAALIEHRCDRCQRLFRSAQGLATHGRTCRGSGL